MSVFDELFNNIIFNKPVKDINIVDSDGNTILQYFVLNEEKVYERYVPLVKLDYSNSESSKRYYILNTLIDKVIENKINLDNVNKYGEDFLMIIIDKFNDTLFMNIIRSRLPINLYKRDNNGNTIFSRIKNMKIEKSKIHYSTNYREKTIRGRIINFLMNNRILKNIDELKKKENKDMLIDLITALSNEYDEDNLRKLISEFERELNTNFNVNVYSIIQKYQEQTPKAISRRNEMRFSKSQRAKTKMTGLLGENVQFFSKEIAETSRFIDQDLYVDPTCFCLNLDIGEHTEKILIPVTRFAKSLEEGYYGTLKKEIHHDAIFTWYYYEPESDFVLVSNRTFVARNKLQAFLILTEDMDGKTTFYEGKDLEDFETRVDILKNVSYTLNKFRKYIKEKKEYNEEEESEEEDTDMKFAYDYSLYNLKRIRIDFADLLDILKRNDEIELNNEFTNYFRQRKPQGTILFEGGELDYLDIVIGNLAREKGYDTLILTHQSGTYKRLVSEVLDVRPRRESVKNIYRIK